MNIKQIKTNTNNPRVIKGDKFNKLVQSIKDFPEMLSLRPIVIDENNIVLGGNMRLRACTEAGLTDVPVKIAKGLTEEQKKEFIVKDNVGFGEWDWDILANEFENSDLNEWGLDVWDTKDIDLNDFFTDDIEDKEDTNKIILEYNEKDYNFVIEQFNKKEGSKEDVIYNLLK
jgi:hypothetical protein